MYLLDTNAISEMRKAKRGKADEGFTEWLSKADKTFFYTSAVVMMELECGVLSMERKDKAQGAVLRAWLEAVKADLFYCRILPIDETTAEICATLHIPDKSPENDSWIAATAKQHRLILITRNETDFERTGVKLFNPFSG
ncbi:type II toxin-antitoxin system VapC family toxin [Neisseria chenwenguii]|uniref:VapC toxin family PIN domain ribonuclease n=1 Tax=Neisseria chenwenguii TaxID=1853278 RepID=A0A220S245_9NEIS|nr:type II toxin-antitoxin system VapC family toxin [Neisseria chenwenguii]ASK27507.1 VapC toxin family PIN domain ribonuclease [Neisseria chenwenguii]ROV55587.1 type II toxin-antitoxin system VapC family toxin [Neisseria chenwenguii]